MNCMYAIQQSLEDAYAHHIQRLMLLAISVYLPKPTRRSGRLVFGCLYRCNRMGRITNTRRYVAIR